MHSSPLRKENLLPVGVLVFSLLVSAYIVFGQGLVVSTSAQNCVPQPSGLISGWNGDTISGTTASDIKGSNDGTINSGVTIVPGKVGNAFKFDGSSGHISMGNPANLNFGTGPFSLEAWFNWDGGGSDVNNIIRKSNYGPDAGAGYWLRIAKYSKTVEFSVGATTQSEGQTLINAPISSGVWHHVVATKDTSGAVKLYVDGESVGTIVRQSSDTQSTSDSQFALGFWPDQNSEFFSGLISEVSLYSRALGAPEVQALFNAGSKGMCSISSGSPPPPTPSPSSAIQYPVAELGDCKDASDCHAFCDDYKNLDACASFAKEHNILTDAEIEKAKKFDDTLNQAIAAGGGPGACKTMDECQSYCEIESNIPTCLKFVEEFNLLPFDKLEELKHVATGIKAGGKLPGDCRGRENCFAYCESPAHMEECITFGEQAGFISSGEADQARKVMPYMARGETPGKCTRKEQCDAYCSKPNHAEECIAFAEKAGLLQGTELEQAKKVVPFLARGETPGGCTSKETCDAYCQDAAHSEECISFAEKAGLMTKDEAEMIRKTGGKGPGGCHSKDTCEAFCNDPANQQTCMDFAKENGMGTAQFEQKKAAIMQEMQNCVAISSCGGFMSCMQGLQAKYGGGQKQQQGQAGLPSEVQAKMNTCIAEMQKGAGGGQGGGQQNQPPANYVGPGGCKSQEECMTYCSDTAHREECAQFSPPQSNQQPPPGATPPPTGTTSPPANYNGPGGCTNQTDCMQYCSDPSHQTECAQFAPPTNSSGSGVPTTSSQPQYQVDCSMFSSVPSCSYITDPQGYQYCKQCYPDK